MTLLLLTRILSSVTEIWTTKVLVSKHSVWALGILFWWHISDPTWKGLFQHATWKVATSIKHNHAEAQVKEKNKIRQMNELFFLKKNIVGLKRPLNFDKDSILYQPNKRTWANTTREMSMRIRSYKTEFQINDVIEKHYFLEIMVCVISWRFWHACNGFIWTFSSITRQL